MNTTDIEKRYNELSASDCCLSCGGALNYSEVKDGEVCVDLGSGRGTDVLRLAEKVGEQGFVYGVDISEKMVETAKKNAEKFNINNVDFIISDLENIGLKDDTTDLVVSNCTINHLKNKDKIWGEIYRILKTGGRFVVSDIYSIDEVPEEYSLDPKAVAECWAGAVTKSEYINTLNLAGFKNIEILEESKPYLKGKINVASFTIAGSKSSNCCC